MRAMSVVVRARACSRGEYYYVVTIFFAFAASFRVIRLRYAFVVFSRRRASVRYGYLMADKMLLLTLPMLIRRYHATGAMRAARCRACRGDADYAVDSRLLMLLRLSPAMSAIMPLRYRRRAVDVAE